MSTIQVNQDLCTRCGICSTVCAMGVISPASEDTLPKIREANAAICIGCGHCEAYCPSQALLLNDHPEEKVRPAAEAGNVAPNDMGYYLRKRRCVRHYMKEPVPKNMILELLDITRYARQQETGSLWNGSSSTTGRR